MSNSEEKSGKGIHIKGIKYMTHVILLIFLIHTRLDYQYIYYAYSKPYKAIAFAWSILAALILDCPQ